jgi:hypothetical protein
MNFNLNNNLQTITEFLDIDPDTIDGFNKRWLSHSAFTQKNLYNNFVFLKRIGFKNEQIVKRLSFLGLPEKTLEQNYLFLKRLGILDKQIPSNYQLLGFTSNKLQANYQSFIALGLTSDVKTVNHYIQKYPQILRTNPEDIKRKLQYLLDQGLTTRKILANLDLLANNSDSLIRRWALLKSMGISKEKLATNPQLLKIGEAKLKSNYNRLIKVFSADFINTYASILSFRPETVEGNIKYLTDLGIGTRYSLLYLTSVETKRKKVQYLAEMLFGVEGDTQQKRIAISNIYKLIRQKPKLLIYSVQSLAKMKPQLSVLIQDIQSQ